MKNLKLLSLLVISLLISFILVPCGVSYTELQENKLMENQYDLVIISPRCYSEILQKFVEYKNSIGVHTFLKTTEEIYKEYFGFDNQEDIKFFIKDTYDIYNISYVLLIGDIRLNPPRYCYNNDSYFNKEPYFISDLYFADLYDNNKNFSSWDSDQDGLYGEWDGWTAEDHDISLTPEISIGRLPCCNHNEVKLIIHKIIQYEQQKFSKVWFNTFVVAGGDTYSEYTGYNGSQYNKIEGEIYTEEAIQVMKDFSSIRLWSSLGTLSSFNIITSINKGCGFVYFSGHGSSSVWLTHPYNSSKQIGRISNIMMSLLFNGRKLPVCIVGGCHNSQFDKRIQECWSWKLTSKPFGGAIAAIGCTGLGYNGIEYGGGGNDWLNLQFFKEYRNGTQVLGEIWKQAIFFYLETFSIDWNTPNGNKSSLDAKTVQEWVLIGDPSLRIGGYDENI